MNQSRSIFLVNPIQNRFHLLVHPPINDSRALLTLIRYISYYYHSQCVKTGKGLTDNANEEYFGIKQSEHIARLPVASYRLATDKASDGVHGNLRGAYSFCMCPVSTSFVDCD